MDAWVATVPRSGETTNRSLGWRRINPRTLILINAILPVLNMLFPSIRSVAIAAALSFLILLLSAKYLFIFKSLICIAIGAALYGGNRLFLHSSAIELFLKMTLFLTPSILIAIVLVRSYHSSEILSALQQLHLPKIIVIALTITLRYIPTFKWEFSIFRQAMQVRGVPFSFRHPIRTFEYLLVPQLFRCLLLSAELTAAGFTKGIGSPQRRTSYFSTDYGAVDYGLFVLFLLSGIWMIGGYL